VNLGGGKSAGKKWVANTQIDRKQHVGGERWCKREKYSQCPEEEKGKKDRIQSVLFRKCRKATKKSKRER